MKKRDPITEPDGTEIENFDNLAVDLRKLMPDLFVNLKGSSIRDQLSNSGKWIRNRKITNGQQLMSSGTNEPVSLVGTFIVVSALFAS